MVELHEEFITMTFGTFAVDDEVLAVVVVVVKVRPVFAALK
jgi:hypothetical protein